MVEAIIQGEAGCEHQDQQGMGDIRDRLSRSLTALTVTTAEVAKTVTAADEQKKQLNQRSSETERL